LEFFASRDFRAIVIDEAQAIKNSSTAQSGAVRNLKGRFKVALTGTPIENGLTDLWSIFDFLNPGLLGSANKFKEILGRLESRGGDQYAPLRRLVAPYVLRRLKTDKTVITDLPDKTEMTTYCWLTPIQAKFYAKVVVEFEAALKDLAGDPGAIFKRRALVLQTLLKLKQLCNHPAQLTGDMDWRPELSGKFQRLAELARGVAERGEKVLIFSQFREIIAPLDAWLTKIFKRSGLILHGGTPVGARLKLVEDFQSPDGPPYFILSLKAGGTGLNLTAAAHVIHFDRWWNPAVEDQATDRAYRVGQSKNVLVHKFVTQGTMEERIDGLLSEKRGLAEEVLGQRGGTGVTDLDDKALLELIRLDLDRAVG
jgi:non-specific serine/threonine protein kinase